MRHGKPLDTVKAAPPQTLEVHPLLKFQDEDPESAAGLEILLRSNSVRFNAFYVADERGSLSLSVHVTPVDFVAFVEAGRAHGFVTDNPDASPPAFREGPLLLIGGEGFDKRNYVEIWLGPKSVRFAVTVVDRAEVSYEKNVYISSASFTALIERCHLHKFEGI